MSKAAELAALIGSQSALSNRNLIINGAMQVAQRGTSASNPGGGYHTIDRFRFSQNSSGLGNYTTTQSTDVPSGEGFSSSMKITNDNAKTVANDMSAFITQKIEGQNVQHLKYGTSSAESVTVSFYVRSSVTGTFCCHLFQAGNDRAQVKEYTISSANTFEKKTLTFTGDTANSLANDNTEQLRVSWVLGSGSDYELSANSWVDAADSKGWATSNQVDWIATNGATFYLTGLQLELGEQATSFEHRSFGDELAACQRYTYVFNSQKINGEKSLCNLAKWSNGYAYGSFSFPMEMRTAPSATVYNKTEFYVYIAGSVGQVSGSDTFGVANQTTDIGEVYIQCGEGSSGQAGFMRKAGSASGTSSGYIVLDAEL